VTFVRFVPRGGGGVASFNRNRTGACRIGHPQRSAV